MNKVLGIALALSLATAQVCFADVQSESQKGAYGYIGCVYDSSGNNYTYYSKTALTVKGNCAQSDYIKGKLGNSYVERGSFRVVLKPSPSEYSIPTSAKLYKDCLVFVGSNGSGWKVDLNNRFGNADMHHKAIDELLPYLTGKKAAPKPPEVATPKNLGLTWLTSNATNGYFAKNINSKPGAQALDAEIYVWTPKDDTYQMMKGKFDYKAQTFKPSMQRLYSISTSALIRDNKAGVGVFNGKGVSSFAAIPFAANSDISVFAAQLKKYLK